MVLVGHTFVDFRSKCNIVFDCLPVFAVMDTSGLKWLITAWLESVEKVWTLQNLAAALLCLEDDRTTLGRPK